MIIALLTDFGTSDYFVGAMKGSILKVNPNASIVDITHTISRHDVEGAAFTLEACYRDFPEDTIFVSVGDPGVGSDRRGIVVKSASYMFVAPDNGLLTFVFSGPSNVDAFEISNNRFRNRMMSSTFHGRDVFAPAAGWLSLQTPLEEFGPRVTDPVEFRRPKPIAVAGEITASVIHIDHFGNIVTNLREADLKFPFQLQINGTVISENRQYYDEQGRGEIFTIWGSAGYLEVSARGKSAADILGIAKGADIGVKRVNN